jgi:hypothetical protein
MRAVKEVLRLWLPLAVVATVLSGLAYVLVQQSYRQNANDPQLQMARDIATRLEKGESRESLLPPTEVDMASGLAPFVIVYGDTEEPLASSASLHGKTPKPPAGVLAHVRENGESRLTWQPERGVRIASVVVRVGGAEPSFVLAGRSLREVEGRIGQTGRLTALAWIAALAGSLILVALGYVLLMERPNR